ncbi:MAG: tetratricopeptide repeat protein [Bacteroidales bacterium]
MKKYFTLSIILFLFAQTMQAQLSVTERRQMERLYNAGIEQFLNRDYLEAMASFDQCLAMDHANAKAYLNRGKVNAALGNLEASLADFDLAIQHNADFGEAYFYKGYFLFGRDTAGVSREMLQMSLTKGFELAESHYLLGLSNLLEGEEDKALMNFNRAINLKDDYAIAYHDRAGIKRTMGDFNGALYDYKAAVNYWEDFPVAYNNMGSVKMVLGDYEGAITDYNRAIQLDAGLYLAYNNRGYASYQLGMLDTAMVDFTKAVELYPGFMEARMNASSVYAKKGELEIALDLLNEVITIHPGVGILYLNRGLVKEMSGDIIGACEDWQMALDLGEEKATEFLEECK